MRRLTLSSKLTAGKVVTRLWLAPGLRRVGAVLGQNARTPLAAVCRDADAGRPVWEVKTYTDLDCLPEPDFTPGLSHAAAVTADDWFDPGAVSVVRLGGRRPRARRLELAPGLFRPESVALTPEGALTLAACMNTGVRPHRRELVRWNLTARGPDPDPAWRIRVPARPDDYMTALAVSPDGRLAAVGRETGWVTVWTLSSRRTLISLPAPKGRGRPPRPAVRRLAFSPDGRVLAVLTDKRTREGMGLALALWSIPGGKSLGPVRERGSVNGAAFAPDGRTFLTACGDGTVGVWDAMTWKLRTRLDWRIGPLHSVAVSPDGLTAAAGGESGQVVVWDLEG